MINGPSSGLPGSGRPKLRPVTSASVLRQFQLPRREIFLKLKLPFTPVANGTADQLLMLAEAVDIGGIELE